MATDLTKKQEVRANIVVLDGNSVSRTTLEAAIKTAVDTATSGTSTVKVTSGNAGQDITVSKTHTAGKNSK